MMNNTNREDKMDQALPLATTETLRPLIKLFLDKLTAEQWAKLGSGSVDKETENVIKSMCVDIINIVSKYIYEVFKQSLTEGSDLRLTPSPPKSPRSSSGSTISENQVHDCLGDTIPQTLAEVMGVKRDICCQNSKEVTDIVAKEVTERVNSELSKSSGSSGGSSEGKEPLVPKTSTRRLNAMARHVVKILKKLAAKMTCMSSSINDEKDQQSQKMKADEDKTTLETSTEQDMELDETGDLCLTPVISLQEDGSEDGSEKVSSVESTMVDAVKRVLEEQASDITPMDDNISQEEYDLLLSSNSQNTEEAASEIVRVVMEKLKLEEDDTPKSSKTSCWKRVGRGVKAFLVHKFAKEAIFSFVTKLRSKLDCSSKKDKASIKQLIDGVDCLVEDMIPPEEDQEIREGTDEVCLYKRIAGDISSGHLEIVAKQLSDVVFYHLKLGKGRKVRKVQFLVEIRAEVDAFMKMMWNWLNKQAQQHERKGDRVSMAIRQIERAVVNLPQITAGPMVMESDTLTPVSEAAPASITDEPAISDEADEAACEATAHPAACEATAHPVYKLDELCCLFMVSGLVNQILKNLSVDSDTMKTTIMTLKAMLWAEIADSDICVKQSGHHIKRTIKAVHKDLCKKIGSAGMLRMTLLSQDPLMYESIIETLKRHLVTPQKKTSVNRFFKTVFKTMAKPFTACFKNGRKE